MGAPLTGPCAPWADASDIFDCKPCMDIEPDQADEDLAELCITAASEILFKLSAEQFSGECAQTVRPCRRSTGERWRTPVGWDDSWGWCSCNATSGRQCGCGSLDEITLGIYPLTAVSAVWVDGVELPDDAYRIDDYRYLVRIDGEGWPCCQDLSVGPHESDAFSVDVVGGNAPPTSGVLAAKKLGCELYQVCIGGPCKLPERVQSVTRQNVQMVVLDPFAFLEQGKTGIYLIDLFLRSYNPEKRTRRAQIVSPDIGPPVRRAGT